jgi:hypothetical protein
MNILKSDTIVRKNLKMTVSEDHDKHAAVLKLLKSSQLKDL